MASWALSSYRTPPFHRGEVPRCIVVTLTGTWVLIWWIPGRELSLVEGCVVTTCKNQILCISWWSEHIYIYQDKSSTFDYPPPPPKEERSYTSLNRKWINFFVENQGTQLVSFVDKIIDVHVSFIIFSMYKLE